MNQRGFITLEIILVTVVVSILIAAAVPKISKMLEKIALDYEIKRFYSEVRFMQTSSRLTGFDRRNFSMGTGTDTNITMNILKYGKNSYYYLSRGEYNIRETHFLSGGINFGKSESFYFKPSNLPSLTGHITFGSPSAGKVNVYFDSVGRWRGLWEEH